MAGPRIVVIGAGPAGVRAAEVLVRAGIRPTLVDESHRDGGQIYRRQPLGFVRTYAALYGTEAARAEALHRCFDTLRKDVDYLPETLVWNVADDAIYTAHGSQQQTLPFDAMIVCSGATDRVMPVKGWNLAGSFTLGGAQNALKLQACAVGRRVVFVGTGSGFQVGPGVGETMAELIHAGSTSIDLTPYRAHRFMAMDTALSSRG